MNCDIHVCCEHKNYFNDKWINCDHFRYNPLFEEYKGEREYKVVPLDDNIDYSLLGAFTKESNYGKRTFLLESRGLPKDIHRITKQLVNSWDIKGYYYSYFTLREFLDYIDKDSIYSYPKIISNEQVNEFDKYHIYTDSGHRYANIKGHMRCTWIVSENVLRCLVKEMKKRCSEVFHIWNKDEKQIMKYANKFRIVICFGTCFNN